MASPLAILLMVIVMSMRGTSVPLMALQPAQALGLFVAVLLACVPFMALLCWALEARLGPRRTGLARI